MEAASVAPAGPQAGGPAARAGEAPRAAGGWIVAVAALLLLPALGRVDVWAPDEPRYVQVAEELRSFEHGARGLVLLHLNGEAYTQKPPLYFWLAALAGAPLGRVTEGAGRLPSALAGIGLVALTFGLGRRLLGAPSALLGAALLLGTFTFADLSRRAALDVLLALFETTALAAFLALDRGLAAGRGVLALLHGGLGLAVLTKGPVGFLVPALVIVAYLAWERRLGEARRLVPPWALLLSIGPGLAWIGAAVAAAPEGFAGEAVGSNLFGRFFAGTSHARPPWYYLGQYPVECLPWTLLWPWVWLAARRHVFAPGAAGEGAEADRRAWRFLLAWVGASLVFFSLSSGKRGLYLVPTLPAAALLCGDALVRGLEGRVALPRALRVLLGALAGLLAVVAAEALLAGAAGASLLGLVTGKGLRGGSVLAALEGLDARLVAAFGAGLLAVLAAALGASAWLSRRAAPALTRFGVAVAVVLGVELAVFHALFPALDASRSPRALAEAAAAATPPGTPIGLHGHKAMTGGLLYYGGRRVVQVGSAERLRRYAAEHGGAIVLKARKLPQVEAVVPVEVVARARAGRREALVVRPRTAADAG
jgi:4-amino-4-deoxy-L-arabinose transferase-like glycosyltransferase